MAEIAENVYQCYTTITEFVTLCERSNLFSTETIRNMRQISSKNTEDRVQLIVSVKSDNNIQHSKIKLRDDCYTMSKEMNTYFQQNSINITYHRLSEIGKLIKNIISNEMDVSMFDIPPAMVNEQIKQQPHGNFMRVRHCTSCPGDYWYAIYDFEKNVLKRIGGDNETFYSMSAFARRHKEIMRPDINPASNGWNECEFEYTDSDGSQKWSKFNGCARGEEMRMSMKFSC